MLKVIDTNQFFKLSNYIQKLIDDGLSAGISGVIYHKDKIVFCKNFGYSDLSTNEEISFDTVFRIQSMTKPITSMATLILQEEGKLNINDPVSKYIPKFANMKILDSFDPKTGETKYSEPKNQVTIKHLLTHSSGLTFGFFPSVLPIDQMYTKKLNLDATSPENYIKGFLSLPPLNKWIEQLTELPLAFEPGTKWWYAYGHEVMGYLIEIVSGQKLDLFFKEKIFQPLGMKDTGFSLPETKWHRVAKNYIRNEDELTEVNDILMNYHKSIEFLSGGAGLVSTLEDYLSFCKMLLQGGLHNGKQYVSEELIKTLMKNHLIDSKELLDIYYLSIKDPGYRERIKGLGYGLGGSYKTSETLAKYGMGTYSWVGFFNTLFWLDPSSQVIAIFMNQLCPSNFTDIPPLDLVQLADLIYECLGIE